METFITEASSTMRNCVADSTTSARHLFMPHLYHASLG
jgi:hypothetical protein